MSDTFSPKGSRKEYFEAPRFMTDGELRAYFGLSERALYRLRRLRNFPSRDEVINKTDRKAVDHFFDVRSGLVATQAFYGICDGEENWS